MNSATLYQAIREEASPAVRIRGHYVIPIAALDRLIANATDGGGCVDPARLLAERRTVRDAAPPDRRLTHEDAVTITPA